MPRKSKQTTPKLPAKSDTPDASKENHIEYLKSKSEFSLLCALVAGEAIGELFIGQIAVAFVPLNRFKRAIEGKVRYWPKNLKDVILQKHQFSCFWSDWNSRKNDCLRAIIIAEAVESKCGFADIKAINERDKAVARCVSAAYFAYHGLCNDPTNGADHYYSLKMKEAPDWASKLTKRAVIGNHAFFAIA